MLIQICYELISLICNAHLDADLSSYKKHQRCIFKISLVLISKFILILIFMQSEISLYIFRIKSQNLDKCCSILISINLLSKTKLIISINFNHISVDSKHVTILSVSVQRKAFAKITYRR